MTNNKESIIQMYFIDKLRPVDIAKKLNISKSAVTQILQKDERYLNEKQTRKNFNKQKHNEDSKKLTYSKRKIKEYKNNVDDLVLKKMQNQAAMELSEHKGLSNLAYRDWNKSAYSYNEKKSRFEFRAELGRSYDVPKYIKVEV